MYFFHSVFPGSQDKGSDRLSLKSTTGRLSLPYFLNIPTLLSSRKLELRFRNLSSILNTSTEEVLPGSTDKAKPLYISTTIVREKFVKKFVKTLKVGLYMQISIPSQKFSANDFRTIP